MVLNVTFPVSYFFSPYLLLHRFYFKLLDIRKNIMQFIAIRRKVFKFLDKYSETHKTSPVQSLQFKTSGSCNTLNLLFSIDNRHSLNNSKSHTKILIFIAFNIAFPYNLVHFTTIKLGIENVVLLYLIVRSVCRPSKGFSFHLSSFIKKSLKYSFLFLFLELSSVNNTSARFQHHHHNRLSRFRLQKNTMKVF